MVTCRRDIRLKVLWSASPPEGRAVIPARTGPSGPVKRHMEHRLGRSKSTAKDCTRAGDQRPRPAETQSVTREGPTSARRHRRRGHHRARPTYNDAANQAAKKRGRSTGLSRAARRSSMPTLRALPARGRPRQRTGWEQTIGCSASRWRLALSSDLAAGNRRQRCLIGSRVHPPATTTSVATTAGRDQVVSGSSKFKGHQRHRR